MAPAETVCPPAKPALPLEAEQAQGAPPALSPSERLMQMISGA